MNKYRVFYRRDGDPITATKQTYVTAYDKEDAKRIVRYQFQKNGVNIRIMSAVCISERINYQKGRKLMKDVYRSLK